MAVKYKLVTVAVAFNADEQRAFMQGGPIAQEQLVSGEIVKVKPEGNWVSEKRVRKLVGAYNNTPEE